MGQSELIVTDILCVFLSLVLTSPFVKSLSAKIDGNNSVEKEYGIMGSGQHLISTPEITDIDLSFFSWLGRVGCWLRVFLSPLLESDLGHLYCLANTVY